MSTLKIISRIFIKANGTIIPIGLIVEKHQWSCRDGRSLPTLIRKVESVTVIPQVKTNHFYFGSRL